MRFVSVLISCCLMLPLVQPSFATKNFADEDTAYSLPSPSSDVRAEEGVVVTTPYCTINVQDPALNTGSQSTNQPRVEMPLIPFSPRDDAHTASNNDTPQSPSSVMLLQQKSGDDPNVQNNNEPQKQHNLSILDRSGDSMAQCSIAFSTMAYQMMLLGAMAAQLVFNANLPEEFVAVAGKNASHIMSSDNITYATPINATMETANNALAVNLSTGFSATFLAACLASNLIMESMLRYNDIAMEKRSLFRVLSAISFGSLAIVPVSVFNWNSTGPFLHQKVPYKWLAKTTLGMQTGNALLMGVLLLTALCYGEA